MKDYTKLCPVLSKHIEQAKIDADLAPVEVLQPKKPVMTKAKVEAVYAKLFAPKKDISKIAEEEGLYREQVVQLYNEIKGYKNYQEPVVVEAIEPVEAE